jgi:hypothetical protein
MAQDNIQLTPKDKTPHAWQHRLLPFMTGIILTLGLFFFAATLYQLYELNIKIKEAPKLQNKELLDAAENRAPLIEKQWRSLVMLESHVLQQRYHQANVLLMARIWVRYLGFVTGMMLSLIGAAFILGKLREPSTELTLGSEGQGQAIPGSLKVQLVSQSPGIVLVTLGTVLMLVTIMVRHPIEVNDKPVYTSVTAIGTGLVNKSKPADLDDSNTNKKTTPGDDASKILDQGRLRHGVNTEEKPK